MVDSKFCLDKLSQCKVGGPSKPFIDQNLQIQLPDWDSPQKPPTTFHSPIYTHYVGSSPSSNFESPISETELHHVMAEAKRSHDAWKKMQQRLKEAIQISQK